VFEAYRAVLLSLMCQVDVLGTSGRCISAQRRVVLWTLFFSLQVTTYVMLVSVTSNAVLINGLSLVLRFASSDDVYHGI
jgi:hypothetical protein